MQCTSRNTFSNRLRLKQLSTLKLIAVQLLFEYGKSLSSPNQDKIIDKAKHYIILVLMPNRAYLTMGDLRYAIYHQTKVKVSNDQELHT